MRRSNRLLNKRKQTPLEQLEDVSRAPKRRKMEQNTQSTSHLADVTNEVVTVRESTDESLPCELPPCRQLFAPQSLFSTPLRFSQSLSRHPLPCFQWADGADVWRVMLEKETKSTFRRDPDMFDRHAGLDARMRSILLDWLIEVCEVYAMHRETFYMCADYVDRYLSRTSGVKKSQLQLIGITSLFIAAKMEEIYPSPIKDFSYVTDGTCPINEILAQEVICLKALEWDLSPMTPLTWLTIYYQAACRKYRLYSSDTSGKELMTGGLGGSSTCLLRLGDSIDTDEEVENIDGRCSPCPSTSGQERNAGCDCSECFLHVPQYTQTAFLQIVRLLDLSVLHTGWLKFPYSVLAASCLYFRMTPDIALTVSGLQESDVADCVEWMRPFAHVVERQEPLELKKFPPHNNVSDDDRHNIQTHTVSLELLDMALCVRRNAELLSTVDSPSPSLSSLHIDTPSDTTPPVLPVTTVMMTPPGSQKSSCTKCVSVVEEDSGYGQE